VTASLCDICKFVSYMFLTVSDLVNTCAACISKLWENYEVEE